MRIKTIVEMVKNANTLLDIGTDHGKVIIEAIKLNYIKKAIATDINKAPLKRAFNNVKKANLEDKVTFIQSNGFKNINLDYDCVVITGLGYQTVKDILIEPHKSPKFYVFGVQSEIENFRRFLTNNGYKIIQEEIVFEKKYYIFIKAIKENQILDEEDIILGPFLKFNKNVIPYYQHKIKKLKEKLVFYKDDELNNIKNEIKIYEKALKNIK